MKHILTLPPWFPVGVVITAEVTEKIPSRELWKRGAPLPVNFSQEATSIIYTLEVFATGATGKTVVVKRVQVASFVVPVEDGVSVTAYAVTQSGSFQKDANPTTGNVDPYLVTPSLTERGHRSLRGILQHDNSYHPSSFPELLAMVMAYNDSLRNKGAVVASLYLEGYVYAISYSETHALRAVDEGYYACLPAPELGKHPIRTQILLHAPSLSRVNPAPECNPRRVYLCPLSGVVVESGIDELSASLCQTLHLIHDRMEVPQKDRPSSRFPGSRPPTFGSSPINPSSRQTAEFFCLPVPPKRMVSLEATGTFGVHAYSVFEVDAWFIMSQESDVAFWLLKEGVNQWGIKRIRAHENVSLLKNQITALSYSNVKMMGSSQSSDGSSTFVFNLVFMLAKKVSNDLVEVLWQQS